MRITLIYIHLCTYSVCIKDKLTTWEDSIYWRQRAGCSGAVCMVRCLILTVLRAFRRQGVGGKAGGLLYGESHLAKILYIFKTRVVSLETPVHTFGIKVGVLGEYFYCCLLLLVDVWAPVGGEAYPILARSTGVDCRQCSSVRAPSEL